jgi:hypothetical protein
MHTTATAPSSPPMTSAWLAEIEAEIVATAAALSGHRSRLLRLIGQFDAAGGRVATGAISCAHWLADLLDIEVCTAREHFRVAKALRTLPRTRERYEVGEVSYAKVRQLTRVATADNEIELLSLAAATLRASWPTRCPPGSTATIPMRSAGARSTAVR